MSAPDRNRRRSELREEAREILNFESRESIPCRQILGIGLTESVCENDESLHRWLICQAVDLAVTEDMELRPAIEMAFRQAEQACDDFDLELPEDRDRDFGPLQAEEARETEQAELFEREFEAEAETRIDAPAFEDRRRRRPETEQEELVDEVDEGAARLSDFGAEEPDEPDEPEEPEAVDDRFDFEEGDIFEGPDGNRWEIVRIGPRPNRVSAQVDLEAVTANLDDRSFSVAQFATQIRQGSYVREGEGEPSEEFDEMGRFTELRAEELGRQLNQELRVGARSIVEATTDLDIRNTAAEMRRQIERLVDAGQLDERQRRTLDRQLDRLEGVSSESNLGVFIASLNRFLGEPEEEDGGPDTGNGDEGDPDEGAPGQRDLEGETMDSEGLVNLAIRQQKNIDGARSCDRIVTLMVTFARELQSVEPGPFDDRRDELEDAMQDLLSSATGRSRDLGCGLDQALAADWRDVIDGFTHSRVSLREEVGDFIAFWSGLDVDTAEPISEVTSAVTMGVDVGPGQPTQEACRRTIRALDRLVDFQLRAVRAVGSETEFRRYQRSAGRTFDRIKRSLDRNECISPESPVQSADIEELWVAAAEDMKIVDDKAAAEAATNRLADAVEEIVVNPELAEGGGEEIREVNGWTLELDLPDTLRWAGMVLEGREESVAAAEQGDGTWSVARGWFDLDTRELEEANPLPADDPQTFASRGAAVTFALEWMRENDPVPGGGAADGETIAQVVVRMRRGGTNRYSVETVTVSDEWQMLDARQKNELRGEARDQFEDLTDPASSRRRGRTVGWIRWSGLEIEDIVVLPRMISSGWELDRADGEIAYFGGFAITDPRPTPEPEFVEIEQRDGEWGFRKAFQSLEGDPVSSIELPTESAGGDTFERQMDAVGAAVDWMEANPPVGVKAPSEINGWLRASEDPPTWRRDGLFLNPPASVPRPDDPETLNEPEFVTFIDVREAGNRTVVDVRWEWDGRSAQSRRADATVGNTRRKATIQAVIMMLAAE